MSSRGAVLASCLLFALSVPLQADTPRGKLMGGVSHAMPGWFKTSFMNFPDDVKEASAAGKHVLVFLRLEECPYCARMLEENFRQGPAKEFIQKNFDVVAVNIRGGGETVWVDGNEYTETALAGQLKVFATPTVVLLGMDGKPVLQLTGYRDPPALRRALDYVQSQSYRKMTFAEYLGKQEKPKVYKFRDHPKFTKQTNFKGYQKPLAILFEDQNCGECARFHDNTLNHPDVLAELKPFLFVRFDADSDEPIVDLAGNSTTPAKWVKALGLTYRPAVALFNEGELRNLIDNRLFHYHFKERLRYVSGRYYEIYLTTPGYNAMRREELLKQGVNIDYSE